MPRVLLIRPLCEGDDPEFAEPLGIERLAGYLREHGVEAEVLDRRLYAAERRAGLAGEDAPGFWDDVAKLRAKGFVPEVIGLSLMTVGDVVDARRIMSRLRARFSAARFVAGGVFVTTAPDEAARLLPRGTTLLRGEGEAALLSVATGGEDTESCANRPEGSLKSGAGGGCAPCSDSPRSCGTACGAHPRPCAGFEAPFAAEYAAPDEWAEPYRPYLERYARLGCAVNMQTSRGCPGTCTFCATPQLPRGLRRWRGRDVGRVVCEMEHVAERLETVGLPAIFNIVDDDAGPLVRLEALAKELVECGVRVAWSCEMRLSALVGQPQLAERLRALHTAGLTRLFVGVESVNPAILRTWRKAYDVTRLPEVLDALREADIAVQAGYILWHGGQTVEGATDEVRQLFELGIYTHQAATSRLIVFPGSELGSTRGIRSAVLDPMDTREEAFYQDFIARTSELRERWLALAIREPYAAAQAFLSGNDAELVALRQELSRVNEQSYREFELALQRWA